MDNSSSTYQNSILAYEGTSEKNVHWKRYTYVFVVQEDKRQTTCFPSHFPHSKINLQHKRKQSIKHYYMLIVTYRAYSRTHLYHLCIWKLNNISTHLKVHQRFWNITGVQKTTTPPTLISYTVTSLWQTKSKHSTPFKMTKPWISKQAEMLHIKVWKMFSFCAQQ